MGQGESTMMKKIISLVILLFCCTFYVHAREIKISVTPSDAKIYIDGSYYGDGVVTANLKKKDGFIVVKVEKPGYVTLETKIYGSDKRAAVAYTLRRDEIFDKSEASGLVNKYFSVKVSDDLYSINEDGSIDMSLAWKIIHQVILKYFDEIQTTDIASGFIQTPWKYKTFPESEKQIRTRVSVRQSAYGEELAFQIKVSSEMGYIHAMHTDESFQTIDRILKDLEPIISEFQTRIGK